MSPKILIENMPPLSISEYDKIKNISIKKEIKFKKW